MVYVLNSVRWEKFNWVSVKGNPIVLQSVWEQYGGKESSFRNFAREQGGARIWGEIIRGKSRLEQVSQQPYLHLDDLSSNKWQRIQDHLLDVVQ